MRNIKSEYNASMDAIHFSSEEKQEMTLRLLAQAQETSITTRRSGRKLLLVGLAAALLLVTMTGAAVYTRWSRSFQFGYDASEDQKEQAQKSGLSVMLEEKADSPSEAVSPEQIIRVTDQGITITAVQSIVDSRGARLVFRIDGFDIPPGEDPSLAFQIVSINGKQHWSGGYSGGFYDGTHRNAEGKRVYEDGTPVQYDDEGCTILRYADNDGSLEYEVSLTLPDPVFDAVPQEEGLLAPLEHLGSEIVVRFTNIGVSGLATHVPMVEGNWELRWTLTGDNTTIHAAPDTAIPGSDILIKKVEITPLHVTLQLQDDVYWDGWKTLENRPHSLAGVRMKDGTQVSCWGESGGYEDEEALLYRTIYNMDGLLDVTQVADLVFHKGWETDANGRPTIPLYDYVPIP